MSLEEAFLRDIADHPDEDAPRIAFADWLQEQADPIRQARGEFIAAQCAVARDLERGVDRERWKKRARRLLRQHRRDWLPFPLGLIHEAEFRRGFVERVTLGGHELPREDFLRGVTDLFRREPAVRHLRLAPVGDAEPDRPQALDLLELPVWPRLITFAAESNHLDHQAIRALAASPCLAGIRRLFLTDNPVWVPGAVALAGSVHLANLEALTLGRGGLGAAGVAFLARSPYLGRLLYLGLFDDRLEPLGLEELSQLTALRALQLSHCGLEAPHVQALLTGPLMSRLRRLDLSRNDLHDEALQPLLESHDAAGLEELRLAGYLISDDLQQRFRDRFGDRVHF